MVCKNTVARECWSRRKRFMVNGAHRDCQLVKIPFIILPLSSLLSSMSLCVCVCVCMGQIFYSSILLLCFQEPVDIGIGISVTAMLNFYLTNTVSQPKHFRNKINISRANIWRWSSGPENFVSNFAIDCDTVKETIYRYTNTTTNANTLRVRRLA